MANQTVGNYWIRANPNGTAIAGFDGGINSAILRYVGAPDAEPVSTVVPVSVNPLFEENLHPLDDPAAVRALFPVDTDVYAHSSLVAWR